MDLYRTLRISLYLLAGTGAFAISVAERSFFYLALIAVLGVLSFLTIDHGKAKPLSAELTAALTLVLLYLALRPLHDDEHWQAHFPAAVAHFLCAWQGLLFFSVYGGPVLLTYCGSTLAVVVMSGVVQSGPSLVARVACFIAVAVWTLYIHAVWRSRQEFAGLPTILMDARPPAEPGDTGERSGADSFQCLPEGSFWGMLSLVAGMTAACLALGVAVFFSAPRMEGILAFFEKRGTAGDNAPNGSIVDGPIRPDDAPYISGIDKTVSLRNLGRIELNSGAALRAVFSKPVLQLAGKKNRILLKSLNLSEYLNGGWIPEVSRETLESKSGAPIALRDPSLDGPVFHGEEAEQTIEASALHSVNLFAAGPIVRINARKIEMDAEGAVRNPGGIALESYKMTVSAPFDAENLTIQAVADHRQLQRYVRQNGLPPNESEAVGQLARLITKDSVNDAAKARAVQRWLEANRSYTLNLDRLHPPGDPLAHFLLTHDPEQQRGHCGLFASAFVVLCRANNLPTRLCMGYGARVDSADVQSKTAIANNSDAHAWAEVYFKGIGWVPFDPTPAALLPVADPRIAEAQAATRPTSSAAVDAQMEKEPSRGFVQDTWDALLKYNGYEQRKLYERISGASRAGPDGSLAGKGWGGWLGIALAWIGIAAAIGGLVHFFTRRTARRKYAAAGGGARSRAAVAFYNDLLHALSRRGYSRRPGQTPREFADAVLRRGGEAFAPVRDVTDIFEAVRYGGGELEQEEFNRLQDALDKIREMTF